MYELIAFFNLCPDVAFLVTVALCVISCSLITMKLEAIHVCPHFHSLPFLFLFPFNAVHGQPGPQPHYLKLGPQLSSPVAIVIVLLVFIFFVVVFLSVNLRHYLELDAASDAALRAAGLDRFGMCHGLDPSVIRTFPVVAHSAIKEMKIGKWSLECAACLSVFQDYETLRLLPKCGHVFHPSCIDPWLVCCATCPICRAKVAADSHVVVGGGGNSASEFARISVVDEGDGNGDSESKVVETRNREVCEVELSSIGGGGGGGIAGGGD